VIYHRRLLLSWLEHSGELGLLTLIIRETGNNVVMFFVVVATVL
jgi:hypothetical protein